MRVRGSCCSFTAHNIRASTTFLQIPHIESDEEEEQYSIQVRAGDAFAVVTYLVDEFGVEHTFTSAEEALSIMNITMTPCGDDSKAIDVIRLSTSTTHVDGSHVRCITHTDVCGVYRVAVYANGLLLGKEMTVVVTGTSY